MDFRTKVSTGMGVSTSVRALNVCFSGVQLSHRKPRPCLVSPPSSGQRTSVIIASSVHASVTSPQKIQCPLFVKARGLGRNKPRSRLRHFSTNEEVRIHRNITAYIFHLLAEMEHEPKKHLEYLLAPNNHPTSSQPSLKKIGGFIRLQPGTISLGPLKK